MKEGGKERGAGIERSFFISKESAAATGGKKVRPFSR